MDLGEPIIGMLENGEAEIGVPPDFYSDLANGLLNNLLGVYFTVNHYLVVPDPISESDLQLDLSLYSEFIERRIRLESM